MIEAPELTKRYGDTTAVDGVSSTIAAPLGDRVPRAGRRRQVDHHADDRSPSFPAVPGWRVRDTDHRGGVQMR